MLLMQFSSAAIFPHDIEFEITAAEEYNPQRIIVYPMLDVTWYRASGAIWTPQKPSEMWAKICDKKQGFCEKEFPDCQCVSPEGGETNDWRMIIIPNSKVSSAALLWLEKNTDSGTMPIGLLPFFRDVYNPFIEENTMKYISSDGLVSIGNNGEINDGIIKISNAKRNLKNIIYPNDRTNRQVFLNNATIDFNEDRIILDINGEYDYGITQNPCGSKVTTVDSITIKKVGEGNLEIPFSPGALSSCSSFMISLNEHKNYENSFFRNVLRSHISSFNQIFSRTSKICVISDTIFQEYYYVCNNDYTPITIRPTTESSFVLHFNEEDEIDIMGLENVFCGSNAYTVYANYIDQKSVLAKPNIRLNNPRCFRLTDSAIIDIAINSKGETEFQEKVYVSNEGNIIFNPNPSLDWGINNEITYGKNQIYSQNGITTLEKFSIIDPLNDDLLSYIKSV